MMDFEIREYIRYKRDEVLALYESVGWTGYTCRFDIMEQAFAQSLKIYGAYVQDQLVGLIRAVGDGLTIVYIQDLLVHPAYQRMGIGKALLGRIFDEYKSVYQKVLTTDDTEKTLAFYHHMGMKVDTEIGCRVFMC